MGERKERISCALIDLEKQKIEVSEIALNDVPDLTGGWSVHLMLWKELWKRALQSSDRFPILGISTGSLTGSGPPASAGFNWCSVGKNGFTVQQAEGRLGAEIRYAGFDHLLLCGKAAAPIHIQVSDSKVDILSAADYAADAVGATYGRILERSDELDRVVAIVDHQGIFEDKYFTVGSAEVASTLRAMNVKALSASGHGQIKIAEPEAFLKLCVELYEDFRRNKGNEKIHDAAGAAYYLSPWESVDLNDPLSTQVELKNLNLMGTDLGKNEIEDIIVSVLGLCWDEELPCSNRLEHAAKLLSSVQGQHWSVTQLNEMALRLIRINQELLS